MKNLSMRISSPFLPLPLAIVSARRPTTAPATAPGETARYGHDRGVHPGRRARSGRFWDDDGDPSYRRTEQEGPHMVEGEHRFVMTHTGDKIARALGKTLVAPVIKGTRKLGD